MPNADCECNSQRAATKQPKSPIFLHNMSKSARSWLKGQYSVLRRELGRPTPHRFTQRFEPFSKPNSQRFGELVDAERLTIEIRPPFDKSAIAIDDRRDPQSRLKARHRQCG